MRKQTKKTIIIVLSAISLTITGLLFTKAGLIRASNAIPPNNAITDADLWNKKSVDSAITLLQSGDLVVRSGKGTTSYMLMQMNQKDKTYSHCGIVVIENGYPFVYHSIGGEDNPDARVRRDSANYFFSPLNNFGFGIYRYDLEPENITKLENVVRQYYREKRKFDMDFDLKTDDKLYCAEFVYKAVNTAAADSAYIGITHAFGYTFVGIDDLFLNLHTHKIWEVKFK